MSAVRALSNSLADAVATAAPAVVRVDGDSGTSTGLVWADGLVLAATDDEAVTVTAADGGQRAAELVGRDAGTGVAVLRAAGLAVRGLEHGDVPGLRVGHLVLAVARPGKSARATLGVITTLGDEWRLRTGAKIDRYIDTDIVLPAEFGGTAVIADADGALIGFGLTGGLMPCPAAVSILIVCLQLKEFSLGFSIVAAFSFGLALTMISVGVLASWGFQKLAEKSGWFSRVAHRAPYVSSYLLIALGMAFAFRGLAMMK